MKKVHVGARIPIEQHEQITKIATKAKSTVGGFVSLAIKELMRNPQAQRKLELDGRRANA